MLEIRSRLKSALSNVGIYEFWASEDRCETSLFMPKNMNAENLYLVTHSLDETSDEPMERLARFWSPSYHLAKKASGWILRFRRNR